MTCHVVTLPDGRIMWAGTDSDGTTSTISWAVGVDPLDFVDVEVLERSTDVGWIYSWLWSGNPTSPKEVPSTDGTAVYDFVEEDLNPLTYRWDPPTKIARFTLACRPFEHYQSQQIHTIDSGTVTAQNSR